jgi:CopG family nickel-responsive transcriptional regulator
MALTRFGVAIDQELLSGFDELVARSGARNRSEAIRDLIRHRLVADRVEAGDEEAVGTITLVYSHEIHELTERLTEAQHHDHDAIISTMHIHLDPHRCLEVLVVRGEGRRIQAIAERLIATKGVVHGTLTLTTTGAGIA